MRKCEITGKICFLSEDEIKEEIKRIESIDIDLNLGYYRCIECDSFHLTRK